MNGFFKNQGTPLTKPKNRLTILYKAKRNELYARPTRTHGRVTSPSSPNSNYAKSVLLSHSISWVNHYLTPGAVSDPDFRLKYTTSLSTAFLLSITTTIKRQVLMISGLPRDQPSHA